MLILCLIELQLEHIWLSVPVETADEWHSSGIGAGNGNGAV